MDSFDLYLERLEHWKSLEDSGMTVNYHERGIDEVYFENIDKTSSLLIKFFHKYIENITVNRELFTTIGHHPKQTFEELKLCFVIDVYRCFNGLDHSTSFNTQEGFGLMLFLSKMYAPECVYTYKNIQDVSESTLGLIELVPYIAQCSYELPDREYELFISKLLLNVDPQKDVAYRRFLYSFCKAISEADGVISISEKEWLETILHLDDDDPTNDITIDG